MTKKRKTQEHSRFVALDHFMLNSPAWVSLGIVARAAYVELAKLYNGSNNGRLALSTRGLAERLPVHRATANRALQELEAKGFIEAVRPSGFNLKTGERRASEWRLTRYFCHVTNAPGSRAFMDWKPHDIQNAVAPRGHYGRTTRPPKANIPEKQAGVASSCDRSSHSEAVHGRTTRHLIDICHGEVAADALLNNAQQVGALKESSDRPIDGLDRFETFGGAALKTIQQLSEQLAPQYQSWRVHPRDGRASKPESAAA